ncbi:MAG: response regulator [Chitinivibrionales bacterium]|nr:response regulator [Chitinivibrionales bacterium]
MDWKESEVPMGILPECTPVPLVMPNQQQCPNCCTAQQSLNEYRARYDGLFFGIPIALIEQDFSLVHKQLLPLQHQGVSIVEGYLHTHPQIVKDCGASIRTIAANAATMHLLQISNKSDCEAALGTLFYKEAYDIIQKVWIAFLRGTNTFQADILLHTMPGTVLATDVVFYLPPQFCDDWSHVFVSIIDSTEKKALRQQLLQLDKMDVLGQLASGIAHGFNNQLTTIMGNADLLIDELKNSPLLSRQAETIVRTARQASEITKQILSFGQTGRLQCGLVDMHSLITEVVTLLQHSIDKKITVSADLFAALSTISVDASQLRNCLLNLALNAVDAMPCGGELRIVTELCSQREVPGEKTNPANGAPFLKISVKDNGIGMDDSVQHHLFEPFFTTKKNGKGTGIGLTMVQNAIKNNNGSICVTSAVGIGTTFSLFFPTEPTKKEFQQTKPSTEISTPASQSMKTILFIDDEELIGHIASEMLQKFGYTVITFTNPIRGLEYYKANWATIDLVILDMIMPDLSGKDTFYALRDINANVIAVLCSGYSDPKDVQEIMAEGIRGFIQKPFKQAHLSKIISELLNPDLPEKRD